MERAIIACTKVPNGKQNVDRLSDLPDGVICHILSFLPTRTSVQTSILAKRWRTLWAHVPVLDFNYWDYFFTSQVMRFPSIVCIVMLRHKVQSLNTFRLTHLGDDDDHDDDDDDGPCYELETSIATAVERNVQNIHLAFAFDLPLRVEVPRCLLTCKTLVDLTMKGDVRLHPTAPISLPNLKKLHLMNLRCKVDFTRLISGCSMLEELIFERSKCGDPRGCYLSSPTLKRLIIICLLDESMFDNSHYMVTINTPALTYLVVDDCSIKHFSISFCAYLVEADIRFDSLCEADDFWHRSVLKFLDSIRNVKCLKLSGSCDKIFESRMLGYSIAKFGNLTKLEFYASWYLLTKFLESADHLQVLTISEGYRHSIHWLDPVEERCAHVLHCLRNVKINGFGCTEQGFNMVRYILRNAQVLERMEIISSRVDWKEKFDAIREISLFRRESNVCELDFS